MSALRIMLVDACAARADLLAAALLAAGHGVVSRPVSGQDLYAEVARVQPDVVVIETDSPDRDTLEGMQAITRNRPRPLLVFTRDDDPALIRQAVEAGVAAYVVGDIEVERVRSVLAVAIARFEQFQSLRRELDDARLALEERKLVERAKGLLMKTRKLDEAQAYAAMRRMAMDRNLRLGELARSLIAAAELLS